jgi:hypothetical protein
VGLVAAAAAAKQVQIHLEALPLLDKEMLGEQVVLYLQLFLAAVVVVLAQLVQMRLHLLAVRGVTELQVLFPDHR